MSIYLEDNPPARSQYRVGRRAPVRSVIVVHTAESGTDFLGPDPKAENVANFIRTRPDPGSYHLLGDSDSFIQLVDFENEAYGDATGSNRWAIHISLAMNAADWPRLSDYVPTGASPRLSGERRDQFLTVAADMAATAARWLVSVGLDAPVPVRLTKSQSNRKDASGFIAHGGEQGRDPVRRTDPGAGFPWEEFFRRYTAAFAGTAPGDPHVAELQRHLNDEGPASAIGSDRLAIDGIFGPKTLEAALDHVTRSELLHEIEQLVE